jgi:hypothetical protein
MRASPVVMLHVGQEHVAQAPLAEDDYMVEAF